MIRMVACASTLACFLATSAFAQQASSSVDAHYARYRAAIEAGDTQSAEDAASAALSASQQRDGNGGATATLAYNLALVRIDAGRPVEAQEPATLALQLAESGSASDLDPLAARLVFGQAKLAASPDEGAQILTTALATSVDRADIDERAFRAAAALGFWAFEQEQFALARTSWTHAVAHVRGQTPGDILARERARTALSVAMIAEHADNPRATERDHAYALLSDAMEALYPFAIEQAADGALTPFQVAFAEASGWRGYGRVAYTPREDITQRNIDGQPVCKTYWSGGSGVQARLRGAFDGSVGVGVFRILMDREGRITSVDTAFATPAQEFSSTVTPNLARLRARRASDAEAGCIMPSVTFQTVVFVSRPLR